MSIIHMSQAQWNQLSLGSEGRHYWTESDIKRWLLNIGYAPGVANTQTAWLTGVTHGFCASRNGNDVYLILK